MDDYTNELYAKRRVGVDDYTKVGVDDYTRKTLKIWLQKRVETGRKSSETYPETECFM